MTKLISAALLAAFMLVGAACGGDVSNEATLLCSDPASEHNLDTDDDGFTPCEGDCDDADPEAYPGGIEASDNDGYDQDCSTWTFIKE